MNSVMCLKNVIDYIEEHLREEMDVDMLAKVATLSPFYFHRLFSKNVNKTVMEYIKSRRLTKAAREIKNSEITIKEIACNVGYKNYETFTRDFKREFSITPSDFKKDTNTAVIYTPKFDIKLQNTWLGEGEILIADEMVLQINVVNLETDLYAIGISKLAGRTKGKDDPGMLWGLFSDEITANIPNQVLPHVNFGIGISNYSFHGFTYIVARQVTSLENVPEGYTSYAIPAGLYAVCTFEAENFNFLTNEALYKAANYMINVWLSDKNEKFTFKKTMTIEVYDENSLVKEAPKMRYYFPVDKKQT